MLSSESLNSIGSALMAMDLHQIQTPVGSKSVFFSVDDGDSHVSSLSLYFRSKEILVLSIT